MTSRSSPWTVSMFLTNTGSSAVGPKAHSMAGFSPRSRSSRSSISFCCWLFTAMVSLRISSFSWVRRRTTSATSALASPSLSRAPPCSATAWGRPASTRPTRLPRPRVRRPGRPAGRFDRSTRREPEPRPPGQHRAGPVGPRRGACGCSPAQATTTAAGRLVFGIFAALAERELIRRTHRWRGSRPRGLADGRAAGSSRCRHVGVPSCAANSASGR